MDDFQHFEPFPPETRMEMPEMSYEQELLNTPVPFSNRVEFLSEYEKFDSKPMTARQISEELSVSIIKTNRYLLEVGALFDENGTYEEHAFGVVKDEVQWQNNYEALEEYLTVSEIGEVLSKSEVWVKQNAYGLGVYPESSVNHQNQAVQVYSKSLVVMLRTLIHQFPPNTDLYNVDETKTLVGKDRKWIERMVQLHNLPFEVRRHSLSQKLGIHYPQNTIDALEAIRNELPPPAGDWFTVRQLAKAISKSLDWVEDHLGEYRATGELRLTDSSRIAQHYSPEVLEYLQGIVEELPPPANDWMTEKMMAKKLGRTWYWIKEKIEPYAALSEIRLTSTGNKPFEHFPPSVYDALQKMSAEEIAHAGGWVNETEVSEMLVKSRFWVKRRIGSVGIASEIRFDRKGHPRTHYPPEIIDTLQLKYLIDEENGLEV